MSGTEWCRDFPRLWELYRESDQTARSNWFPQPGVVEALTCRHSHALKLEALLQELSLVAWEQFKSKARNYVHKIDKRGYWKQLFECFHEVYGYVYLKEQGYEEIEFIEEQPRVLTPDLRARKNNSVVLMEVKTVNESDWQKDYFDIPRTVRNAVRARYEISGTLKHKLLDTIGKARRQLLTSSAAAVQRKIVYLVIRPDFNFHGQQDLATLFSKESDAKVEIVMHLID